MKEDDYLKTRLEDQIKYYSRKSRFNKGWYYILRTIEGIAAISIPLIISFGTQVNINQMKMIVSFIGSIIAVITVLLSLYRFQELWIEYRSTSESLKHEKYKYLTRAQPYVEDNSFEIFVISIEDLISKQHRVWKEGIKACSK